VLDSGFRRNDGAGSDRRRVLASDRRSRRALCHIVAIKITQLARGFVAFEKNHESRNSLPGTIQILRPRRVMATLPMSICLIVVACGGSDVGL